MGTPNPNAPVETIKSVLTSLQQKLDELEKLEQTRNSIDLQIEKANKAVSSLRTQLAAELRKFDPYLKVEVALDVREPVHA